MAEIETNSIYIAFCYIPFRAQTISSQLAEKSVKTTYRVFLLFSPSRQFMTLIRLLGPHSVTVGLICF